MLLKTVAILFGVIGVLVLADAVLTVVWQEPVSGLLAHFQQARLAQSLKRLEGQRVTPADERALSALPTDDDRIAFFARRLVQTAGAGQAVGRIRIPRIGANFVVVAGTDESSLQKGPGIYAGAAVPGLRGTVGIAGHRTTYLAPFRRINELARGDRIALEMPYGVFTYTVLRHQIVSPSDVSVLQRASYDQVVLTACNPLYSAAQRIVVFARLTAAAPSGPALSLAPLGTPQALPSPAEVSGALLGDASSSGLGPAEGPPPIDIAGLVLGDQGNGARGVSAPRPHPAAPRPAVRSGRAAAARPAAPRRPSPLAAAPLAVTRAPTAPPVAIPRQPAPTRAPAPVVRPEPAPVNRQAPETPQSSPPATSKPAVGPPQTRVQGTPGGPTPIIGVPSPSG